MLGTRVMVLSLPQNQWVYYGESIFFVGSIVSYREINFSFGCLKIIEEIS